MTDLRNILFDTLERVVDGEMELDRAAAVVDVSKQLIETAKVEVAYIKAAGGADTSPFIEDGRHRLGEKRISKGSKALELTG